MEWYSVSENDRMIMLQNRLQNVPADQKVLIAALPGDRETAAEIGREILAVRNLQVLILKDAALCGEEWRALCEGAMLAVFVISAAFLRDHGAPCRRAFREAAETPGLRMLLVQTEKNIEGEFDRVCGPYQLLDRTSGDYSLKLGTFIEGYADPYRMIGSEETLGMQEGLLRFKVFISYRKKDLAYLQRITAAIRGCPQLAGAALWYDDSLVSGENYNEQIDRALESADLVLFAVTDHFAEEGNYVLVSEYPRTVEAGKPTVAVLMEGTNEAEIRRCYPRLDVRIPFEETEAWLGAILSEGNARGKLEASLSADQLYALACEYENGVRTTGGRGAALNLFQRAAEGGNPQAMARLAGFYAEGMGVERDPERALALNRRALSAYEKRLEDDAVPSRTKSEIATAMYRLAGQLFRPYLGEEKPAEAAEMVRIQQTAQEAARENGVYLIPVDLYMHRAMLLTAEGAYAEALTWYDRMEALIPGAESCDRPVQGGDGDTIYMKGVLMHLELFMYRGHVHCLLVRQGEMKHLPEAVRDLRASMKLFLLFGDQKSLDRLFPGGRRSLHQNAADLTAMAAALEGQAGGMAEAQRIYEELCLQLDSLLQNCDSPELMNQYGLVLTNAAMAGKVLPDREKLEKADQIYELLCSRFPRESLYIKNGNLVKNMLALWPASADVLGQQGIQPERGAWLPVQIPPAEAQRMFSFSGAVPAGVYGDTAGTFRVSGYRCPHCSLRLYKTTFPEGRSPRLYVAPDGGSYLEPARVFGSPCGRFFAAPKGRRLTDGLFLQAILVLDMQDKRQAEDFMKWWNDLSAMGDLNARRQE